MLKGLLKMSMLKIISENKTTGYQIIKKVTQLTGEKPSTGSIYPLLKSMQTKGWIKGTTQNGKTTYEITTSGLSVVQAHGSLKGYYEQKLNGTISLIHDTFNNQSVTLTRNLTLVNPVVNEVTSLLAHGVTPEKINTVLSVTLVALQKLLED
jgi:DNA-binding PadR family transcriptional regulator